MKLNAGKFSITIALLVALVGGIAIYTHKKQDGPADQKKGYQYSLGVLSEESERSSVEKKSKQINLERSSSSASVPSHYNYTLPKYSSVPYLENSAPPSISPSVSMPIMESSGIGSPQFMHAGHVHPVSIESYAKIKENKPKNALKEPLSTVSIDVDTASYSNCRRILRQQNEPPADAVRIEEFINYFSYEYPQPQGDLPFSVTCELAPCPWNEDSELLLIGFQGKKVEQDKLPPANLVFLADTSGSMSSYDKLPLLQKSMKLLTNQLREEDRVAIVTYAGSAGLALPATSGAEKGKILAAIDNMSAGGSTAGGAGIKLAYKIAEEHFNKKGLNRVILATDGDFNVGPSSNKDMKQLIKEKRKSGIFLSVLGFGTGNIKDSKMETLADNGNGNYAYIDTLHEAKKQLGEEFGGTLMTIAKDVKFQIEFNPRFVDTYRLVGYENRVMAHKDFDNDKKDAGDLGAGHSVTVLYEVERNKKGSPSKDLAFQDVKLNNKTDFLKCKLRYKATDEDKSKLVEIPYKESKIKTNHPSSNHLFASAVAEFGLMLRDSKYQGDASAKGLITRTLKSLKVGDFDETSAQWKQRTGFLTLIRETRHVWDESHLNSFIPAK